MRKNFLFGLVLLILLLPLFLPLLSSGFFVSDDGPWMAIRLAAFHQTLKTGQFPVRFLETLNHGYGYPVLNFLYPFPFYLGEILHLVGFSFANCIKILLFAPIALGSVFVYRLVEKRSSQLLGLLCALVFAYHPYISFDIFSRGSVGEIMAIGLAPILLFFLNGKNLLFSGLLWSFLIMSHNTLGLFLSPVILILSVFVLTSEHKSQLLFTLGALTVGIGLSAFFWGPALFDLQFTKAGQISVSQFEQYFFQSGAIIALITLILALFHRKKTVSVIFGLISLAFFLSSPLSGFIWNDLPLPKIMQFPWRAIALAIVPLAILPIFFKRTGIFISSVLACTFLFSSLSTRSYLPTNFDDAYYLNNDATTTVKNEYMPKWVTKDPTNTPPSRLSIISGKGIINSDGTVTMETPGVVQLSKVYFPGFIVNGHSIDYSLNGLIRISLEPGFHNLTTKFIETPERLLFDLVSLLSVMFVFSLLALRLIEARKNRVKTNSI